MDSNDQVDSTGNQHNADKSDIPLWLQGLEESTPGSSDVESENDWVKEEEVVEAVPSLTVKEEQVPQEDQEEPEPLASAELEEEITSLDEKEPVLPRDDEIDEKEDDNYEEVSTEEGFVEISEYDFDLEQSGQPDQTMLSDEEELPEWLHEMIAETPEIIPDETIPPIDEEIAEALDEPTEPMVITQETIIEIEEEKFELSELPPEVIEELPEEEPDFAELIEEAEPESSTAAAVESDKVEDEQPEEQEIPRMLIFAKYLLDEGDISSAVEIFTSYMGQSLYREQIRAWLMEFSQQDKEGDDGAAWESLGDVAMEHDDSELAFIAYTKAIQILVSPSRESNEIS
jgi:hypothetical protein